MTYQDLRSTINNLTKVKKECINYKIFVFPHFYPVIIIIQNLPLVLCIKKIIQKPQLQISTQLFSATSPLFKIFPTKPAQPS